LLLWQTLIRRTRAIEVLPRSRKSLCEARPGSSMMGDTRTELQIEMQFQRGVDMQFQLVGLVFQAQIQNDDDEYHNNMLAVAEEPMLFRCAATACARPTEPWPTSAETLTALFHHTVPTRPPWHKCEAQFGYPRFLCPSSPSVPWWSDRGPAGIATWGFKLATVAEA
jgi:hypothetical protein